MGRAPLPDTRDGLKASRQALNLNLEMENMPHKRIQARRASSRKHYASNKEQYQIRNQRRKVEARDLIDRLKDQPCMDCWERYPSFVMQFDHRDPATKLFNVGSMLSESQERIATEVAKCDVICANCHAIRTHG